MKILKHIVLTILIVSIAMLSVVTVSADFGPKPIAYVEIKGVEEPYYFDLIVYQNYDVQVLTDTEVESQIDGYYYRDDYPSILNGYQDDDGFAAYSLYTDMPHTIRLTNNSNIFQIGYFRPPTEFKIVIVTESNNILVSEVVHRTFFYAFFVFDLTNDTVIETELNSNDVAYIGVGNTSQSFPIWNILFYVLLGLVITLFIEVGLLYLIRYRDKNTFKIVIITNIVTQVLLNVFLWIGFYVWYGIFGYIFILIIGEIIVFVVEIIIYNKFFKERQSFKPVPYAILANFLSFLAGFATIGLLGF